MPPRKRLAPNSASKSQPKPTPKKRVTKSKAPASASKFTGRQRGRPTKQAAATSESVQEKEPDSISTLSDEFVTPDTRQLKKGKLLTPSSTKSKDKKSKSSKKAAKTPSKPEVVIDKSSSSDSDSSSDDEELKRSEKKVVPVKAVEESSSDLSDSDSEEQTKPSVKKQNEDDSSDSSDSSDSDSNEPKKPEQKMQEKNISSDNSDSSESDSEEPTKAKASKKADESSSSDSSDSDSDDFDVPKNKQKTKKSKESPDSDSSSSKEPERPKKRKTAKSSETSDDESDNVEEKPKTMETENKTIGPELAVFVNGLPFTSSASQVRKHFSKQGAIENFVMPAVPGRADRNRGFAIISFKNKEDYSKALELSGSEFMERTIKVFKHMPREKRSAGGPKVRIFISGLSPETAEPDLRKAFKKAGEIKSVNVLTSREGKPTGNVIMEFGTEAGAEKALKKSGSSVCGSEVHIKHAFPRKPASFVGNKTKRRRNH